MPDPDHGLALVADIGGTNTRCALARGREVLGDTARRYANAEHPGIEAVLARYRADAGGVDPDAACVAAAGPVADGAVTMTNIAHWPTITRDALMRASGAEAVAILNDLQAQGHAIGHVDPALTRVVLPFPPAEPGAARLVVNVGTGFNVAMVFEAGGGRIVPPAEAGHAGLPVRDEADLRLARHVGARHGFASIEEVVSGRGIVQVHEWLGEEEGDPAPATSAEIVAEVASGAEGRARRAGRVFARVLGRVAGDLALTALPFGGVWLVGGLARAFGPHLLDLGFADAFRDKGRFSGFMERFGVGVVEDDAAALTGCAAHLVALLEGRAARS